MIEVYKLLCPKCGNSLSRLTVDNNMLICMNCKMVINDKDILRKKECTLNYNLYTP